MLNKSEIHQMVWKNLGMGNVLIKTFRPISTIRSNMNEIVFALILTVNTKQVQEVQVSRDI